MVGSACGFSHQAVAFSVREAGEINACLTDQVGQFTGRQSGVDVLLSAGIEFRTQSFVFFCDTWHDGHCIDVLGSVLHPLRAVGLRQRTVHADGRLAGRKMRQQFRVERFGVFLPAGAARCELGKSFLAAQAFHKLRRFFPYGDVCREFRVPTVREAQCLEGGQHLPSSHSSDRQAKASPSA